MSDRMISLEVLRYDPETDKEPYFQTYTDIPCPDEWVVLDALNYIKDNIDTTLSYRWSCHMAVCGSCGMVVDGEPMLACKAFIRDYGSQIRVEPLDHFPIERDLVTQIDDFIGKLEKVKPYMIPKVDTPKAATGENRQTPHQLKLFKHNHPVYQLHAVLRRMSAVWTDPGLYWPRSIGPGAPI